LWYHRDCIFRRLQMGPGIVDRHSLCCTRRNEHTGSQSWRMVMSFDGQSDALQASRLFPDPRFSGVGKCESEVLTSHITSALLSPGARVIWML
jgi:hypothetical protein